MVIELTDGNTGEVETIEESNMVAYASNDANTTTNTQRGSMNVTESKVIQTVGTARFENIATPLFQYKQFLTGWGGSYGNEYHFTYLLTPYLATINNLSSAVVKNADKTMKITYTITEEE
jgi:hypothetical protein